MPSTVWAAPSFARQPHVLARSDGITVFARARPVRVEHTRLFQDGAGSLGVRGHDSPAPEQSAVVTERVPPQNRKMIRYALRPAPDNERGPQHVVSLLRSVHQLNKTRMPLTLEIASGEGSPGLFIETPAELRNAFLSELGDAYPGATIQVARRDLGEDCHRYETALRLTPDVLPIRTYRDFEESPDREFADPITGLLSSVRTGRDQRVCAAIRLIIRPVRRPRHNHAQRILERLRRRWLSEWLRQLYAVWSSSPSLLLRVLGGFLACMGTREQTVAARDPGRRKLQQHLFECWLRIETQGPPDAMAVFGQKHRELRSALGRFTSEEAMFRRSNPGSKRGFLLSAEEIATLWHPPMGTVRSARMAMALIREVEPPLFLPKPDEPDVTELGRVQFRQQRERFGIRIDDLRRHLVAIGRTGCGKSTFLLNVLQQQVARGRGVILVDPHGQLADDLLARIASHRTNDVVVLDPTDANPVTLNPLYGPAGCDASLIADGVLTAFGQVFGLDAASAPRLQHIFRNCLLSLVGTRYASLSNVQRLLVDENFRRQVTSSVGNDAVRAFWAGEFEQWNRRDRTQYIASLQNKLGAFLSNQRLQRILCGESRSLDVRQVLDDSRVLVCNLSKGQIGHDASTLLGSLLLAMTQLAAMSRADVPEEARSDATVIIDEFHSYLSEGNSTLADALAESRKYRVSYVLAAQMLDQLDVRTRAAVLGNCGSLLTMTVGPRDAEVLCAVLGGHVKPADLIGLPKYHGYLRMLIDGAPHTLSMTTLPASPPDPRRASIVRRVSRNRHGAGT